MKRTHMYSFMASVVVLGAADVLNEAEVSASEATSPAAPAKEGEKAPEFKPGFVPAAEIFAQYTNNLAGGEDLVHGFELSRMSFGARGKFTPQLGGGLMLEAARYGSYSVSIPTYSLDTDGQLVMTEGEEILFDRGNNRLTMFVKRAVLEYDDTKQTGLKLSFGMTTSAWPIYEENIWGLRYIAGAYTDIWRQGHTVDIGATLNGTHLGGLLDYQLSVVNAEGPRKSNTDNRLQYQARVTVAPLASNADFKGLKLAGYFDYGLLDYEGHYRMSSFASASFESALITAYAGLYRVDYHEVISGGFSGILAMSPIKGTKIFARFDTFDPDWETETDASQLIIAGVAHDFTKGFSASLDTQLTMYEDSTQDLSKVVSIHTRLAF